MKRYKIILMKSIAALSLLLSFSCENMQEKPKLFELLSADQTGITFNNRMQESKAVNLISFAPIYNGAGVGVGDLNNDGLEDLVLQEIWCLQNFTSTKETCSLKTLQKRQALQQMFGAME